MPDGWKYALSFAVGVLSMLLAAYIMASGITARLVALETAATARDSVISDIRHQIREMPQVARQDPFTGRDAKLMEERLRHECERRVETLRRDIEKQIR